MPYASLPLLSSLTVFSLENFSKTLQSLYLPLLSLFFLFESLAFQILTSAFIICACTNCTHLSEITHPIIFSFPWKCMIPSSVWWTACKSMNTFLFFYNNSWCYSSQLIFLKEAEIYSTSPSATFLSNSLCGVFCF